MKPALFVNKTKNYSQIIEDILYAFPNALTEKEPDIIFVVGGDGTMFQAVKELGFLKIPFFGIANGTLNFLMNSIKNLKWENFSFEIEKTFFLNIKTGNKSYNVVNDVVFGNGIMDYFHFNVKTDGYEGNISAGGLCISTPLGSTAFHYNNGGNIIPSLNLPLVGVTSVVGKKEERINKLFSLEEITVNVDGRTDCFLFLDGKTEIVKVSDSVKISRGADIELAFLNLKDFKIKRIGV